MREDRGARAPGAPRHLPHQAPHHARVASPVMMALPCHLVLTCLEHVDITCPQQMAAFRQGFGAAALALGALSLTVLGVVAFWS